MARGVRGAKDPSEICGYRNSPRISFALALPSEIKQDSGPNDAPYVTHAGITDLLRRQGMNIRGGEEWTLDDLSCWICGCPTYHRMADPRDSYLLCDKEMHREYYEELEELGKEAENFTREGVCGADSQSQIRKERADRVRAAGLRSPDRDGRRDQPRRRR